MTLIAAYYGWRHAFIATDRRLTLIQNEKIVGIHDENSNKTVVLFTNDGIAVITYTGDAYIDGIPTDVVIASHLYGEDIMPSTMMANRDWYLGGGISTKIHHLRAKFNGRKKMNIKVVVVGYRLRRRRFHPFSMQFKLESLSAPESHLKMTSRHRMPSLLTAGAHVSLTDIERAAEEVGFFQNPYNPGVGLSLLKSILANKHAVDMSVGEDLMYVHIDALAKLVECRFESKETHVSLDGIVEGVPQPVSFSPFLVFTGGVFGPSQISSSAPTTTRWGVWETRCYGADPGEGPATLMLSAQPRTAPPGQRRP